MPFNNRIKFRLPPRAVLSATNITYIRNSVATAKALVRSL